MPQRIVPLSLIKFLPQRNIVRVPVLNVEWLTEDMDRIENLPYRYAFLASPFARIRSPVLKSRGKSGYAKCDWFFILILRV
jgi:hypothetical protein